MSKSKNRRGGGRRAQTQSQGPTLEEDISVAVIDDKVVPAVAERETPRMGVSYAADGRPTVTVEKSSNTLRKPTESRAVAKVASDNAATASKPELEAEFAVEPAAKEDLRGIASSVALAPSPEPNAAGKMKERARVMKEKCVETSRRGMATAKSFLASKDVHKPRDVGRHLAGTQATLAQVAFTLRIGLGALFVVGGVNKLMQLLSPASSGAIVASYTSTTGYINEFFMAFLFASGTAGWTPWSFLTALSAFELVSGLMLLAGVLVRPIALIYAFLLWSFVIALPVVTTNGVDPGVKTYMAPAILVQIRDIALSGMMFVLYGLGSGLRSIDLKLFGEDAIKPVMSWDVASLMLRLSIGVVLIVGGVFAGMPSIKTYIEPGLLLAAIGVAILWGGLVSRYAAGAACAVVVVYMLGKLGIDKGLVGNLNAIKRELALFAGVFVLAARESGYLWSAKDVAQRLKDGTSAARENARLRRGMEPAE